MLETPLVARGGDRFVLRSFSPVTTIGGGVVLDPTPASSHAKPGPSDRRLALDQAASERLVVWALESDLGGIPIAALAVRLGVVPGSVTSVIVDARREALVTCGEYIVARGAIEAAVARLVARLRQYHAGHPLDPGMSLQALRSAITAPGSTPDPPAVIVDHVVAAGIEARLWEVQESIVRESGWRPALDTRATAARQRLLQRLTEAQWQIPTLTELEREFTGEPVPALLAHLAREGAIEQVDRERMAPKQVLEAFRRALEAALQDLGAATPAQLRDRLGLTRKYLIPLLEWADRRGITQRIGDTRALARLTS
jgi:selenocysteine-specific elongation factor